MSTLTRTNSHNKKPKYKDYVSFLDSYRGGKKDDQSSVVTSDSGVNFSLDSSANNSSSSVFSDVSDGCEVQKKPTKVKSEVFIQISDPTKPQPVYQTQVFKVEVVNGKDEEIKTSVGRTAMIFENDHNNEPAKLGLKPKQNSFRQNSVEEMAKKFETNRRQSNTTPRKSVVNRSPSIGKVAKVFENQPQPTYKPKNFNTVPKPFQPTNLPPSTEVKSPVKPVILSPKPVIPTPTFPKFTSETTYADSIDSALSSLSISPSPPQCPSPPPMSPPPPPMPPVNFSLKLPPPGQKPQTIMSPPPPPMPPVNFAFKTEQTYLPTSPPPPLPKSTIKIPLSPPPPPPPLPPQSATLQKQKLVAQNGVPKKPANGTIDKNDPRLKKAVYGALRNMYGAYHDQANDYLATLPKNRVRKNNGLDSIIDSIAEARFPGIGAELRHYGYLPSVKLKNQAYNNTTMDPPQCVQNAMMTKDKKPFTYTPGGIDLSEVKSPRMQRRIERNAHLGGAGDMPQPPQPPQHVGPLPPSALAAMRPQTQVQVFPGPPPPPPMKNIPPPPPPPSCPLPTQKVTTGENQIIERPDMTKIIPENPMALLRKTGGPAPRKSLVDQGYEELVRAPPAPPQRSMEAQSPRPAPVSPPVQRQPQPQQYHPPTPPQNQQQPAYYQPTQQQYQPPQPQYQPPQPQYQPPQQQYQAPQPQYQPPQPQYQQPPPPQPAPYQQPQQQQRFTDSPKPGAPFYPPVIERQPAQARQEPAQKNVSSNVGSLYIPPLAQQQKVASPPTPPERQTQSPGTPTLKEAPRPWQQRSVQQELPPWAKKDEIVEPVQQTPPPPNRQNRWQPQGSPVPQQQQQSPIPPQPRQQFQQTRPQVQQQSPRSPPTQNQNSFPVHIEIRTVGYPPDALPAERNPNAVYVTQPIVLQHPGNQVEPPYKGPTNVQPAQPQQFQQARQPVQQQQSPKVDGSGARIIPIQIEGRTTPSVPAGDNRNYNRQSSWGNQPTQSNTFKVIQKITKTDDEEDDTPITQHSARYPQEMPEQMRRMKINDNGQFKQGNGQAQPYVHPSEQVVPEPKKYMGSNIPSRSFKILQAMTAPSESSANANYNEEQPTTYNPPVYPYSYPYFPAPYWPDYYSNYYPPEQSEQYKNNEQVKNGRQTPHPPMPVYYRSPDHSESFNDKSSKGGRSTPLPVPMPPPYWGYAPPPPAYAPPRSVTPKPDGSTGDENYHYPMYPHPPYYDPYYYPPYYYGYPPIAPPYPYYAHSVSENDEYSGYSSMDEMSSYNPKRMASLQRRNSLENESNSVQALKQHFELRSKSAAPRITITPTYSQENIPLKVLSVENNDQEGDTEVEEEEPVINNSTKLRSIKSVQNLNVYSTSEELDDDDTDSESEDSTEEETDDEEVSVEQHTEEIIPHQLSVIFEESERGESRRSFRCNSVASETTTITEHNSEEENEEDFLSRQNVQYKIKLFQETHESFSMTTDRSDGSTTKVYEEQNEKFSFQASQTNNTTEVDSDIEVKNKSEVFAIEDVSENVTKPTEESSNEDWWGVIEEKEKEQTEETISQHAIEKSVKDEHCVTKCEAEPNSVMVEVGDEVVCVKLRNKSHSRNHTSTNRNESIIQETIDETIEKTGHDVFFSSVPQRNSIYDILKNDENDEEVESVASGGTLMRVDSFASQLEAIKRNSGLFTLESIKQPSVIKEESFDVAEAVKEPEETVNKNENKQCTEEINVTSPVASSDEVDFWSQIKTDDDDFTPRRRTLYLDEENENQPTESIAANTDSADSSNSSCSSSQENAASNVNKPANNEATSSEDDSDESSEEEQPIEEETIKNRSSNSRSRSLEPQTIKERIEALRNSIAKKQQKVVNDEPEEQQRIRTRISSIEVPTTESRSKTTSTKSSIKSFEGYSEEEEELDSGVISDISRHISDSEEFPELRKMTRYERAATHSRLFKLLQDQDECDTEEEREEVFVTREDKFSKLSVRRSRIETHQITHSRSKLSLPLNTCISEGPPVNEKLVEELVQSLLKSKKAQAFKNMPKEKLYAAAVKILQEGIESGETPSEEFSSLLSPLRGDTESSTPAQTPQEFYGDSAEYRQYYESWSEAAIEIMPSKAFKLLSEHIEANKLGSIEGILAKCPRILSSKNIPKEVMKLLDESDSDCSRSQNSPNSNDITNT